jgi:hypothetical protein
MSQVINEAIYGVIGSYGRGGSYYYEDFYGALAIMVYIGKGSSTSYYCN